MAHVSFVQHHNVADRIVVVIDGVQLELQLAAARALRRFHARIFNDAPHLHYGDAAGNTEAATSVASVVITVVTAGGVACDRRAFGEHLVQVRNSFRASNAEREPFPLVLFVAVFVNVFFNCSKSDE